MKNTFIIVCVLALLVHIGCSGNGIHSDESISKKTVASQPSDTLYTEEAAMQIYATQPERALQIIDSAELLGNLTDVYADYLRAMVYSRTIESIHFDSAILIAERLMQKEEVLADSDLKENVLEVLLNACRMKQDNALALYWATQLGDSYHKRGKETEALRIDAETGTFLVNVGQGEEGMAKIDKVIHQLNSLSVPKSFNNLDASIIALKRKNESCLAMELYNEMIPTAQRMLDLLNDYEQHPGDFHDGSSREPPDEKRPQYIDFYRGKAYCYMAMAYASLHENDEAERYVALYEQTFANQGLTGRLMIAPTLGKLGEYERMLAIYDEVEQQWGNDTLNEYYAEILKARADAAMTKNQLTDAYNYLHRYIELKKQLHQKLMQSKAYRYAARFQYQKQQREIERQREATRRAELSRRIIGFIGLFIFLCALYAVWQWRKTQRRNYILAQQITEAVKYKEMYSELKRQMETPTSFDGSSGFAAHQQGEENLKSSTQGEDSSVEATETQPLATNPAELSDADLFEYLRDLIEREQMFLDPSFERQTLIDRTGLSKERIGAAFAQASDYERLTTLVRELRLNHAVHLLNEQPELNIEQVCMASGFANTVSFNRSFKAKFGMTPSEFRGTKA